MCSRRSLLPAGLVLALALVTLGASRDARADEPFTLGLEAHGERAYGAAWVGNRYGISLYSRWRPELAFGVSLDNSVEKTVPYRSETFVLAFADARLLPSSFAGGFGRVSLGLTGDEDALLGLELGPELRLVRTQPGTQPRLTWYLRGKATLSLSQDATYVGLGLSIGCEG